MSNATDTIAIVDLIEQLVDAADAPLTRGDIQTLLVAGRHDAGRQLVATVLNPSGRPETGLVQRVSAVIEVAKAADIDVVRKILV